MISISLYPNLTALYLVPHAAQRPLELARARVRADDHLDHLPNERPPCIARRNQRHTCAAPRPANAQAGWRIAAARRRTVKKVNTPGLPVRRCKENQHLTSHPRASRPEPHRRTAVISHGAPSLLVPLADKGLHHPDGATESCRRATFAHERTARRAATGSDPTAMRHPTRRPPPIDAQRAIKAISFGLTVGHCTAAPRAGPAHPRRTAPATSAPGREPPRIACRRPRCRPGSGRRSGACRSR